MSNMKPALAIAAAVIQSLLALALTGISVYVLWLTRSPEILNEPDSADAIHGLKIGAVVIGIPAILLLIGSWGLWKNKRWSWWLSILTDSAMFGLFAYGLFDENRIEWDEAAFTVCFAIFSILLLLPAVRKFYWTARDPQSASPDLVSE